MGVPKSKAPTYETRNGIEGEITLNEINYASFKKMKGTSTLSIDGFTANWFRQPQTGDIQCHQ